MTTGEYAEMVRRKSPASNSLADCARAFVAGGGICAAGQGIFELYRLWGADDATSRLLTSVTLIFIGVLLTAAGVYDKLARKAGAGTLVPITGFANAMSAPAIEFKSEGFIAGVGTKLFAIAGPVIVYGVSASVIYGAVLWALHLMGITLF